MLGVFLMACASSGVTVGSFTAGQVTPGSDTKKGYDPSNVLGGGAIGSSLTPASLGNGRSLRMMAMYLDAGGGSTVTYIEITGYGANPGQSSLRSMTCNSIAKTGASADGYSYAGGVARWSYNSNVFSMPASGSVSFIASLA